MWELFLFWVLSIVWSVSSYYSDTIAQIWMLWMVYELVMGSLFLKGGRHWIRVLYLVWTHKTLCLTIGALCTHTLYSFGISCSFFYSSGVSKLCWYLLWFICGIEPYWHNVCRSLYGWREAFCFTAVVPLQRPTVCDVVATYVQL